MAISVELQAVFIAVCEEMKIAVPLSCFSLVLVASRCVLAVVECSTDDTRGHCEPLNIQHWCRVSSASYIVSLQLRTTHSTCIV